MSSNTTKEITAAIVNWYLTLKSKMPLNKTSSSMTNQRLFGTNPWIIIDYIKNIIDSVIWYSSEAKINEFYRECNNLNNTQEQYESCLRKLENEVRCYIKAEHQLKLYTDNLQYEHDTLRLKYDKLKEEYIKIHSKFKELEEKYTTAKEKVNTSLIKKRIISTTVLDYNKKKFAAQKMSSLNNSFININNININNNSNNNNSHSNTSRKWVKNSIKQRNRNCWHRENEANNMTYSKLNIIKDILFGYHRSGSVIQNFTNKTTHIIKNNGNGKLRSIERNRAKRGIGDASKSCEIIKM